MNKKSNGFLEIVFYIVLVIVLLLLLYVVISTISERFNNTHNDEGTREHIFKYECITRMCDSYNQTTFDGCVTKCINLYENVVLSLWGV